MKITKTMNLFLLIIAVFSMLSCTSENTHLEKQIRGEILRDSSGIATLEAIYTVSFVHFQENLITSDDFYIQKDTVNIDYGFDIDDNAIQVIDENGRKKLKVKLGKGDVIATNRVSLSHPITSHEGYIPKNAKTGEIIDVDVELNKELENLKNSYGEKNLRHAKENLKNFFRVIAAKYDLDLEFK